MNLCGSNSSWWWSCTHKTYFQVFLSLLWLLVEILWYFIVELVVSTQFIVMVGIIWYLSRKLRRATNRPSAANTTMQQTQRLETYVLVQGPCTVSSNKQSIANPSQPRQIHNVQMDPPAKTNSLSQTTTNSNFAECLDK